MDKLKNIFFEEEEDEEVVEEPKKEKQEKEVVIKKVEIPKRNRVEEYNVPEEEQEEILNIMSNIEEKDIYKVTVKTGQIGKNKVFIIKY